MTKGEYIRKVTAKIRKEGPQSSRELREFRGLLNVLGPSYNYPAIILHGIYGLLSISRASLAVYYFPDQTDAAIQKAEVLGIIDKHQRMITGTTKQFRSELEKKIYRKRVNQYLDLIILSTVAFNPIQSNYGYSLKLTIYEKFGVNPYDATVYPCLDKLVNLGFLESIEEEQTHYRITNEGREFLNAGIKELKSLSDFLRTGTLPNTSSKY